MKKEVIPSTDLSSFSLFYESNVVISQHRDILDLIALKLKGDETTEVLISSNTDGDGEEAYNQLLSQRRADEVMKHLLKAGVDASRIKASAHGETKPQGDNTTVIGKRMNRRTDLIIQRK